MSGTAIRVWKRLRDDEHVYGLGEKNGSLDKRGSKLGGYSVTMWNSDTFGYDASTDPIAGGDVFVPKGDGDAITAWYDEQLMKHGWTKGNQEGASWLKSSEGRSSLDLSFGFGVDTMAPATLTPPASGPGVWDRFPPATTTACADDACATPA